MKAKKMFEKLGYQEVQKAFVVKSYRKLWTCAENFDDLKREVKIDGKMRFVYIDFDNIFGNTVEISYEECEAQIVGDDIKTQIYGDKVPVKLGITLTYDEIQAINKQVKELGWNKPIEEVKENE